MDFDRNVTFIIGLVSAGGTPLLRDVVLQDIAQVLEAHGIDGFTVTEHTGYWKGAQEASISVSILARYGDTIVVTASAVAKDLATACMQDCVLWSISPAIAGLAYSHVGG